jgi:hypothetical protein
MLYFALDRSLEPAKLLTNKVVSKLHALLHEDIFKHSKLNLALNLKKS